MTDLKKEDSSLEQSKDFIRTIIASDIINNKNEGRIHTRFPPEPNGYLHIGHAKSICLNFGIALEYSQGLCNLRFDDTNPSKEDIEYEKSIIEDVKWLGFDWEDRQYYASNYFDKMYEYAINLIKAEKAYVCSLSAEEVREYRGTLTEAGKNSPYRDRSVAENLELFEKMRNGLFEDGTHLLRAKIDMASPNLNMRDPAIYRIKKIKHHNTLNKWNIYPMYDFAHSLSDALEKITHSLCTLEFEDHRPLYNWFLEQLDVPCHPRQIEFARLNLSYTVLSKRKLLELVTGQYVNGWDDPRMPTIAGMRRRGYTAEAIRDFCERVGIAKVNGVVDIALLNFCLREHLNKTANRVMAVLNPLKLVITNYPDDKNIELAADNNTEDENAGKRNIWFSKELYIEREDFMENPPKKFFRLAPGKEVRLKHAYYITCEQVIKDEITGEIIEVHCSYDPETIGGWSDDGRKVKGTLHWVSAKHALDATVRIYDNLFVEENPESNKEGKDYKELINKDSLEILKNCKVEAGLKNTSPGTHYQFLRNGYFCTDSIEFSENNLVFNRTVPLRDSWGKNKKKG